MRSTVVEACSFFRQQDALDHFLTLGLIFWNHWHRNKLRIGSTAPGKGEPQKVSEGCSDHVINSFGRVPDFPFFAIQCFCEFIAKKTHSVELINIAVLLSKFSDCSNECCTQSILWKPSYSICNSPVGQSWGARVRVCATHLVMKPAFLPLFQLSHAGISCAKNKSWANCRSFDSCMQWILLACRTSRELTLPARVIFWSAEASEHCLLIFGLSMAVALNGKPLVFLKASKGPAGVRSLKGRTVCVKSNVAQLQCISRQMKQASFLFVFILFAPHGMPAVWIWNENIICWRPGHYQHHFSCSTKYTSLTTAAHVAQTGNLTLLRTECVNCGFGHVHQSAWRCSSWSWHLQGETNFGCFRDKSQRLITMTILFQIHHLHNGLLKTAVDRSSATDIITNENTKCR